MTTNFADTAPDITAEEDMRLMERIAHKDAAAFQQFYRRYGGLLFSTISKVLNDHHDAEDIMQEVLVQLWQKAHLYEPRKGKPLTWLTTLAKNRAIDRIRSKQRRSRLSDEFGSEHKVTQPEFDESAHDVLQMKERDTMLRSAVTRLTPDQQLAIELTYFGGLTQSEVAERLHEPLGTIKARIRRGVTRLEDLMRTHTR
jgi:RNA polymerase sigma-70 factor, ECF subfamily